MFTNDRTPHKSLLAIAPTAHKGSHDGWRQEMSIMITEAMEWTDAYYYCTPDFTGTDRT